MDLRHRGVLIAGATLAAAGLFMGLAVIIALLGLGRLDPDLNLAAAPGWLWHYRADTAVRRWLAIGGWGAGITVLGLAAAVASRLRRPPFGAARWAREGELRRAGLRAREGLVLGLRAGQPLVFGGSEHVLLYAPTRTGKGVGVVIPNLLTWPHSVIALDVKQENWLASAGYRARQGQSVFLFDPLAPEGGTSRFNPLGHVDRDDRVATFDELQKIAAMLFPAQDRTDPFWSEAARNAFAGVGAYVAETPYLPFTIGEILRQLTLDDPQLRLLSQVTERERSGKPLSAPCASALSDFCATSEKTFSSVRLTLTSRLGLWLNPRVDHATSASDFDLGALRTGRISLYLAATPDNLERVAPIYNLLLQQVIDRNTRALPSRKEERQVLIVLDEFARLGHAGVLAQAFSFVAGYGLRLLAVLQSPAQLRAIYGPDMAEEIISNCGVEIAFAPKDIRVAQALSERLGDYGQTRLSRSRPAGLGAGHRTVSESEQRRALMLPQELLALGDNELIVLKSGLAPVRGRKLRYYRHPDLRGRVAPPPAIRPSTAAPEPPARNSKAARGRPTRTGPAKPD